MKLFLVKRTQDHLIGYDEYDGFVVRAEDEREAIRQIGRYLMDKETNEQDKVMAMDRRFPYDSISITEVTAEGEAQVILHSFNAG